MSLVRLRSLTVQVQLFNALSVAPLLGSCAEVWGPSVLLHAGAPLVCMDSELHQVQSVLMSIAYMQGLGGGLRCSIPRQLLMREFGCKPGKACEGLAAVLSCQWL
jgi:hypothetical protein